MKKKAQRARSRRAPSARPRQHKVAPAKTKKSPRRYWSREVTEHSDALDLDASVFKGTAPSIARSLKRSAERSQRRKSSPFRSAMSMLVFYENRAGKNLSASRRQVLERAKEELRKLFGRTS